MEKKSKIYKLLKDGNTISLSRFIYLCLYEKTLGYYHNKKIGSDFTTSPEISQVFGECISVFLISIFNQIGKINNFCELGPGNGTLAKDLISSLINFQVDKLNYFLYEKSAKLDIKSFNKLSKKVNLKILKKLEFPQKPFIFLGNEFFDALPINQFEKNNIWMERRVKLENKNFKIVLRKNPYCNVSDKFSKKGDVFEISPLTNLYLKKIFKHLKKFGGGFLIFDYGPFKKNKTDTLQAIYNKQKSNFLEHPYKSDITYHIDFQHIKNISDKYNLNFYGPIAQKRFLFFNGINERFINLSKSINNEKQKKLLNSQFGRLTDPFGLGNLIKCIFITKNKIKKSLFNHEF